MLTFLLNLIQEEEEPTSKKKATSKLSTRRIGSRSQKLEENLENQTGRRRARNNTSKYGSQKEKGNLIYLIYAIYIAQIFMLKHIQSTKKTEA